MGRIFKFVDDNFSHEKRCKIRMRYCDFVEEICKTMIQNCPENIYIYKTLAGVRIIEKRYGEAKTYIEKGKLINTETENEEIDLTLFD